MHNFFTNKSRPEGPGVIIAGGATGGHLFPGIAIAEQLREQRPECRIMFVGTGTAIEKRVLPATGFAFQRIATEGIKGRGRMAGIRAMVKLAAGVFTAARLIRVFRPDMIIGVGGYSSAPVVISGWLMGVNIVLHEQNALPGITNRVLSRLADRVFVSFEQTVGRLPAGRVKVFGNPVRQDILRVMADNRAAGTEADGFTVLVVGGSQGAGSINQAVTGSLPYLDKKGLLFIHQTGDADEAEVRQAYTREGVACLVKPFFSDMADQYTKADFLICRAGATTVAEMTCLGKPGILVPFPYAADDHQTVNARALADAGGVEMIPENQLTGPVIAEKISWYSSHRARLAEMAARLRALGNPEAGRRIAEECLAIMSQAGQRRSLPACI